MSTPAEERAPGQPDPWELALEGLELVQLDPALCHIRGDGLGRLWGTIAGREHAELLVYRTFPLTAPEDWVSVVATDDPGGDGHRSDGGPSERVEVGVLAGLDGLEPESRAAVEQALHLRYFLPRVLAITAIRDEAPGQSGAVVWDLQTDRGAMRLRMRNLFNGFQQFPSGRIVLSDEEGNRADIPSLAGLDPQSRRLLLRYYWL